MMSVFQAFVTSLSVMMDAAGLIGTAVFYYVVKQYKEYFLVAQAYRFFFMGMSVLSAIISIMATKLILLVQYSSWALAFFIEQAKEDSWMNWVFRVCVALFYSFTCMQILVVSIVFLLSGDGPRVNRKKKKADHAIMLLILLISLVVGLPYYFYPMKMISMGDEVAIPQTTSTWNIISVVALIPCVIIWIVCLVKSKGHRFLDVFAISIGMGAVVLSISAIYIGNVSGMEWLARYAYLALPIASSFFTFSVLTGRLSAFSVARQCVMDVICCRRGGSRVAPLLMPRVVGIWTTEDLTLDLRGL